MSLYFNIKPYVNAISLQKKKTCNELLQMPKTEFRDILFLYIKLCGVLKGQGVRDIKPLAVTPGEHIDFIERDFDYLILSKGNNILNDLILSSVIMSCAEMCERYISNKLISKNPQYEYFTQFQLANYEGLEYVFNKKVFNSNIIFSYKNADGVEVEIKEKAEYHHMNKADLESIYNSLNTSNVIKALLLRLKEGQFPQYKKFILKAAEECFKGNNLEEDGEYMLEINQSINKQGLGKETENINK